MNQQAVKSSIIYLFIYLFREKYVAGVDVNMGCPKEFSIKVTVDRSYIFYYEGSNIVFSSLKCISDVLW